MKKCRPYVGITGFMSSGEVKAVLKEVPIDCNRLLMVGVLASSKTLAGVKNKWSGRYPLVEKIPDIFIKSSRVLNLIHYSTDDKETLSEQLALLATNCGERLDGFQLNIAWPSIEELTKFDVKYPGRKIVLQIGKKAMDLADNDPKKLSAMVREYSDLIDYVLVDPSGGLGLPFDIQKAQEYLRGLQTIVLCGLGVAGGLSSTTLDSVDLLINEFPYLCIDAEGRLRTPQPDDSLNLVEAKAYVKKALAMFKK